MQLCLVLLLVNGTLSCVLKVFTDLSRPDKYVGWFLKQISIYSLDLIRLKIIWAWPDSSFSLGLGYWNPTVLN